MPLARITFSFFFFNDTATTEIYTLSLHDALPISLGSQLAAPCPHAGRAAGETDAGWGFYRRGRSEEHTSELQSQSNLVCRLLLEKKKKIKALRFGRGFREGSRYRVATLPAYAADL